MARKSRRDIRHVAVAPTSLVLVCRKCSKKLGGGFGPSRDQRLAKLLRHAFDPRPKAKLRRAPAAVIEVGCFDLCPKNAVVVLRGDRPGDWLLVPSGTPVEQVSVELGFGTMAVDRET